MFLGEQDFRSVGDNTGDNRKKWNGIWIMRSKGPTYMKLFIRTKNIGVHQYRIINMKSIILRINNKVIVTKIYLRTGSYYNDDLTIPIIRGKEDRVGRNGEGKKRSSYSCCLMNRIASSEWWGQEWLIWSQNRKKTHCKLSSWLSSEDHRSALFSLSTRNMIDWKQTKS